MYQSQPQPQPRWLGGLIILVVFCSLFGGAAVGGAAGYYAALESQSALPAPAIAMPLAAQPAAASAEELFAADNQLAITPNESGIVRAVATVRPATVTVVNRGLSSAGSGSGFFIDKQGHVVTNNHVVEGARELTVIYSDGGRATAQLVGTAPEFDLAVLRVQGQVPAVAHWGDSTALPLGAQLAAIGSALGEYQHSVTEGVLSGFNRSLGNLEGLLQTDAAINHGNSGGPLVNLAGEVIGINTMVVRGGQSQAEGLGFAIPSNIARTVVDQLIQRGEVRRAYMGVSFEALNPQRALEESLSVSQGAIIRDVVQGSPSAAAGLQPGDIVVAVNGQRLDDRNTLVAQILEHTVGDTLALKVLRNGKQLDLSLTLAPRQA
jgi:S1-C subfamily serine protease